VCPVGHSFTDGVDDKPSVEVLALVRCVEFCLRCVEFCLWYAWNIVSRNRDNIQVCDEQRDLYSIMCCCVNLMICE
jgi:hypothetical protein